MHRKNNIKKISKKGILPSVLLFLVFIGICQGMFLSFVISFAGYVIDSKASNFYDRAKQIGQIIETNTRDMELSDAVLSMKPYLSEQEDIAITDENGQILLQFGHTAPDFNRADQISIMDNYVIYPDVNTEIPTESTLNIPYLELLQRSLDIMTENKSDNWDEWLGRNIIDSPFWTEIPIQADGFRIYYKDRITLAARNALYIMEAIVLDAVLLVIFLIILFINVLSSVLTQRRIVNLYYLDTTTEGKNWLYFIQRSNKILCRLRNAGNTYAVVNLHMDRFQDYCACYGNRDGEELLKKMNAFLQVNIGRQETFARFAAADFGLLLRCQDAQSCEKRIKKLLAELTGIPNDRIISFHAGIYMISPSARHQKSAESVQPRRQLDVNQLYHYANAARESLPEKDTKHIKLFDDEILQEQLWKRKVEDMMEPALLNREFQIYLQPKYNPISQKIVSAEALVRWISPTDGLIPPGRFIPIFEDNGFITRLDDYMIGAVAKLQSEWKIQGKKSVPVSVNVSRANFTKENLADHICQLIDSYGADHTLIELEVTESAFFGDKEMLQKIIRELKSYGFRISMDDFGAGYSSLNSLKDLPVDVLKLDMDFFRGEDTKKRGEIVVKETIRLAKALKMQIVAEGIERKEQVEFLAAEGCDMIQGYYFAKPMPVSDFLERMELN